MRQKSDLRPYQRFCVEHVINNPVAGLFLEPGLGKTAVTLTAIQELMYDRMEVSRVLIVAPKTVALSVWDAELKLWAHLQGLTIAKILGSEKERIKGLHTGADMHIVNVDNISWLCGEVGLAWPFDMLVLDELSLFKSGKTKRFKDLDKLRSFSKRCVGLTGTPVPNSYADLWSQLKLLDQGARLGKTEDTYKSRFFLHDPYARKYTLIQDADKIIEGQIADICISMTKADYATLPPRIEVVHTAKLSPGEQIMYDRFERDSILELIGNGEEIAAINAGVLTGKLLQFAGGSVYDAERTAHTMHTRKLAVLDDLLTEMGDQPVFIAYWYQHERDAILAKYPDMEVFDSSHTERYVKRWNEGKIKRLLVQARSAAHGLNLQFGGNQIIWYSCVWSSEVYIQLNDRLHRSGQSKTLFVHKIVTADTMDETVIQTLERKLTGQAALMDAIKARIEKYIPSHKLMPHG